MSYIQIDGQYQKENECVSLIFQIPDEPPISVTNQA